MFLRVFAVSAGCGLLLGVAALLIAGMDAATATFVAVVSAGPAIIAAALVAAQLARIGARAQPVWHRREWASRGAAIGAVCGGLFLVLWFVAFNVSPGFEWAGFLLAVGAMAGAVSGLLVGLYCARLIRLTA